MPPGRLSLDSWYVAYIDSLFQTVRNDFGQFVFCMHKILFYFILWHGAESELIACACNVAPVAEIARGGAAGVKLCRQYGVE